MVCNLLWLFIPVIVYCNPFFCIKVKKNQKYLLIKASWIFWPHFLVAVTLDPESDADIQPNFCFIYYCDWMLHNLFGLRFVCSLKFMVCILPNLNFPSEWFEYNSVCYSINFLFSSFFTAVCFHNIQHDPLSVASGYTSSHRITDRYDMIYPQIL